MSSKTNTIDNTVIAKESTNCLFCKTQQYKIPYPSLPAVVQCQHCGLTYANPRIKKAVVKNFYSQNYFESDASGDVGYDDYVSDQTLVEATFKRRLREIEKKWAKKKGKVLDVGCATGLFLSVARNMGWDPHGVEISEYCCRYAFKEFGLKLNEGFFEDMEGLPSDFQLITMWDYIEHSHTPGKDIERAFELLAPGGILVLSTPDIGTLPAKISKDRWMGFKEHEHLYYFNKENLKRLLEEKGFRVISTSHIGKYISLAFFAKRLSGYSKLLGEGMKKVSQISFLRNAHFYCNPFDIVYMVAQKGKV